VEKSVDWPPVKPGDLVNLWVACRPNVPALNIIFIGWAPEGRMEVANRFVSADSRIGSIGTYPFNAIRQVEVSRPAEVAIPLAVSPFGHRFYYGQTVCFNGWTGMLFAAYDGIAALITEEGDVIVGDFGFFVPCE
jgi:hypothetical protein